MTTNLSGAPADSTMGRDVASGYLAAATKIGGWVVVSAAVYRLLGASAFADLALIRGTIGLLNYVSLGLAPALIRLTAGAPVAGANEGVSSVIAATKLSYYRNPRPQYSLESLYSNGLFVTYVGCLAGLIVTGVFANSSTRIFWVPGDDREVPLLACFIGIGTLLRVAGDAPGAILQIRNRIARDNTIVASGEVFWAAMAVGACLFVRDGGLALVGLAYALSGGATFLARLSYASVEVGIYKPHLSLLNAVIVRQLLSFGMLVVAAQVADYLYAPTDFILINRLLNAIDVANYAPAVQIDSGLLLLVTGLSAVLLPKAAIAHGSGDARTVRRYYVIGSIASLLLLVSASLCAWLLSPWIFRLWLGNPMQVTQSILPIVLLNTVIGGSSAVGRSILLAIGRVRPFTISVLIAGVTNVLCSYAFVRFFHWGLRGIVLGTVVAVVGRCLIWMPWYVLRTLRSADTTALDSPPSHTL